MKLSEQRSRDILEGLLICAVMVFLTTPFVAQGLRLSGQFRTGDFSLAENSKAAVIIVASNESKVVQIAATDLVADVEKVAGVRPNLRNIPAPRIDAAVIIGTIDKSPIIDAVVQTGKLDVSRIRGKWESFIIATVERPLPNIRSALVIAGSDRRGTAFGVYEVSQMIGVSPWHWWADVTPERRTKLIFSRGVIVSREPSVKYRGIFINDEDWGLQPWAAKTFEPEAGDIGPKTYAKVFELLLRLKANTLWPAMHEVTKPFNSIPANAQVADDYAIVMGSSHAEPMLRNNVGEWRADKNAYNFVKNPDGVTAYWEERAKENGRFENIYTLGMRGIHDSPILGTRSQAERIPLLEKIFAVQRGLIARYVDPNVETVPQMFCPYKEVLADYRSGLKVPDDVTIVFPDDNFGYIRQFPSAVERKRKGGFGVYYHISYLGRPLSYLWLNSTPPALIWQEMNKAYENAMRQFWIVNVGDIKPAEIGMEFFLQMAYDASRWNVDNQHEFLREWATREFGKARSVEIAAVMDDYYRLGFQRKPEHLQWYLPTEPARKSDFTLTEAGNRIVLYETLKKRADLIYASIPATRKDAFYELVLYPVRSAAHANERFFAAELAGAHAPESPSTALDLAKRSIASDAAITAETRHFNETVAGGKWRHMMSPEMNPGQWPSMRSTPPRLVLAEFESVRSDTTAIMPTEVENPGIMKDLPRGHFNVRKGIISIEAENFVRAVPSGGFTWRVIRGLGKTGDSVSIFPARSKTFAGSAPSLEYQIDVDNAADFTAYFHLIPTQPLIHGHGLRIAFSIGRGDEQIVVADADTEVSSRKWAQNILDATTIGSAKVRLTKGRHTLRISAVDTGVVLDKVVFTSGLRPQSYFGPMETRFELIDR